MDPERAADELYALPLNEFTAARNARMSEARRAGDRALASSLKALRKPTVGAWLANLLTRQRTKDIDRLIALGAELRDGRRGLDGDRIRRVSKERADTVSRLVRDASSLAARQGQAVSGAALAEVEATLDAAFADAASADALRAGRLTSALQYSGLGLVPDATSVRPAGGTPRSGASVREAERTLERAHRDAARADADLEGARVAVEAAEKDLTRRKAAVADAQQRAKEAHRNVAAAEKTLTGLRRRRPG